MGLRSAINRGREAALQDDLQTQRLQVQWMSGIIGSKLHWLRCILLVTRMMLRVGLNCQHRLSNLLIASTLMIWELFGTHWPCMSRCMQRSVFIDVHVDCSLSVAGPLALLL